MPSVEVFLRDSSTYLREFRRKPMNAPNGWVDKRDRGLNLEPAVYQFREQNLSATGGAIYKRRKLLHFVKF